MFYFLSLLRQGWDIPTVEDVINSISLLAFSILLNPIERWRDQIVRCAITVRVSSHL